MMDTLTLSLTTMAVVMAYVTWQARRLRNEGRDVALLAALTGALSLSSLASAL